MAVQTIAASLAPTEERQRIAWYLVPPAPRLAARGRYLCESHGTSPALAACYVTVTPDGRFLVSRRIRIKDDFDNGEPYMPFNDKRIWMPGEAGGQPNREALEWHADTVFLK
jgi:hypothetical protein